MNPDLKIQKKQSFFAGAIGVGTFKVTPKAIQYVNDVLRSERLSYGPYLQKFERVFAAAHECRFAVMTNSGTSSLLIALAALKNRYGWQDGDEVLVPAVTFVATANIVLQLNMKPVFVDVDTVYYEIDPEKMEAALTPKTRCLIPVHLFGCPCDMERIMRIARKHNLRVIEDSCETMFTKFQGTSVGAFGDIACFSTYVAHILSTGVGGLCTTNDPGLAVSLRSLANHGRDSIYMNIDDDNGKTAEEMRMIIQRRFSFTQLGYSFRVTEMEGALGLAEFERREEIMRKRRDNGLYFKEKLKDLEEDLQLPAIRPGAGHAFMMFPVVLKNQRKDNLVEYLESRGIETRDMLPLVNQPVYRDLLGTREEDYPVAKWINEKGFYFACHQDLTEVERDYIVDCFHDYFERRQLLVERSTLIVMSNIHKKVDALVLQNMIEKFQLLAFDEAILADAAGSKQIREAFEQAGFKVISASKGKGEILRSAVEAASSRYAVVAGIDGADNPGDANRILLMLQQGHDMVVASRFMPGGGRETDRVFSYRSIGNRFFTFLLSVFFRGNVTDCNNLFRGFKRDAFLALHPKSKGNGIMFELTALALKNSLDYAECPTVERKSLIRYPRASRIGTAFACFGILLKTCWAPRAKVTRARESV
ncbi:MAG TPA: DegT/DnrJ/EryC1/StrS family aminotransferase [bacterium]|nr:DegT/DnrJ/EryC1/StrS family aminotransferase [bacterium]